MNPLSVHTRRQLGYAEGYLQLGLKAEAGKALAEITGEDRDATPVLAMRLAVHTERAEWAKASKVGAMVCEREPNEPGFWIQWAYAVRRHAGLSQAREILFRGVGLHPREAVFHFNLACYEAQLGHLDDARAFLETACGLDETFVELAKTDPDLTPLKPEAGAGPGA
jgi:predicted Zn-dependent protease